MELESLWEMLKADKYSDEGKKVIEEGLTEDKVYKVGEISQKTGLQKQPDGSWAEPKRAKRNAGPTMEAKTYIKKNADGSFSPYISTPQGEHMVHGAHTYSTEKGAQKALEKFNATHNVESNSLQTKVTAKPKEVEEKEDLPDFIKGFSIVSEEHDQDTRAANAKLYPSLQPLVRQREPFMKKRIEAFTKLRDNPGNPKAKADFVDATNAINQIDADIDRAYKKATSDNPYEITESFMKEAMKDPKTRLSQKYDAVKNAKKGSPEYDKAMSEYLKERDVFKQDQGAEAVKEFPITPDCAPRVLTGDCKIRVKR